MQPNKNWSIKKTLTIMIVTSLIIGLLMGLALGYILTWSYSFECGQTDVWSMITKDENDLRNVYSNTTQSQLKQWLPDNPMNFTDGLIWESELLNFSFDRPLYQNVTQVLENGKGACGEYVWVYAAFCVAKNISFRVIHLGYYKTSVVDHAWMQVNPSNDGKTWIHIEVAGSCDDLKNGKTIDQIWGDRIDNNQAYGNQHYKMVLAYQSSDNGQITITDVTSTFSDFVA
jgi:hypothetical protein